MSIEHVIVLLWNQVTAGLETNVKNQDVQVKTGHVMAMGAVTVPWVSVLVNLVGREMTVPNLVALAPQNVLDQIMETVLTEEYVIVLTTGLGNTAI